MRRCDPVEEGVSLWMWDAPQFNVAFIRVSLVMVSVHSTKTLKQTFIKKYLNANQHEEEIVFFVSSSHQNVQGCLSLRSQ